MSKRIRTKKFWGFVGLAIAVVCVAAYAVDTTFQTDKVKLGRASSSADKILEFDTNSGTANPKILVDPGDGILKFANDGVNAIPLGSGAGGRGINSVDNPGFETGTTQGWTASGGTFEVGEAGDPGFTAADIGFDTFSARWDVGASAETVTSDQQTVPGGLLNQNCLGQLNYKGGGTNLSVEVIDGSSVVLASETLSASTFYRSVNLPFVCPTSGTYAIRLVSDGAGDPPEIFFDNMHVGDNFLVGSVSQAQFVGSIRYSGTASCIWTSTSGTAAPFAAVGACSSTTLDGDAQAHPSGAVPGLGFSSLQPGRYKVIASGRLQPDTAQICTYQIEFDSTGALAGNATSELANSNTGPIVAEFEVPTAVGSNASFQVVVKRVTGAGNCEIVNDSTGSDDNFFDMQVWRYPLAEEIALKHTQTGWYLDATQGDINVGLGISTVTVASTISAPGYVHSSQTGAAPSFISCVPPEVGVGTTCSGTEIAGIVFDIPTTGTYQICSAFTHGVRVDSTGSLAATFELAETGNDNSTIVQIGRSRTQSGTAGTAGADQSISNSNRVCGVFRFTSVGTKTVRLFFRQNAVATVVLNNLQTDRGAGADGERNMHWTGYQINESLVQPVILNHVSTDSSSGLLVTAAEVDMDAVSCSILNQTGDWLASTTHNADGDCTLNLKAGLFQNAPFCTASAIGGLRIAVFDPVNTTSAVRVKTFDSSFALNGLDVYVQCSAVK